MMVYQEGYGWGGQYTVTPVLATPNPISIDISGPWTTPATPVPVDTNPMAPPASTPDVPVAAAGGPSVMQGSDGMFTAIGTAISNFFHPADAMTGGAPEAPTTQPAGTGEFNKWLVIGAAAIGIWFLVR